MSKVSKVSTTAAPGQKPGTSGLRKRTSDFTAPQYMENFVQCMIDAAKTSLGNKELSQARLVVGGDGRYFVKEATELIVKMAAANGVGRLVVARDGVMSTPAVSCVIRKRELDGGFILTASHNPGGKEGDFGIKYNLSNGGPAPTDFTDKVFELSKVITHYNICPDLAVDLSKVGVQRFELENGHVMEMEVIDGLEDYVALMKSIFDFDALKAFLKENKVLLNSLHGVTGPYVERIFVDELGAGRDCLMKTELLPDFGGGHPDPNLTYADDLVQAMRKDGSRVFGAAFDGDGDRNMILGRDAFFVTPCDSLAVIANNLQCIPYFKNSEITGYARSMPTSGALDRVAKALNKDCYETPTGWKFFGNLLDANRIQLCGEESFGTGSNHIREKDGIWAALAWLQILATKKTSVDAVLKEHWSQFGRNFFTRYDYENCEAQPCNEMMQQLQAFVDDSASVGKKYEALGKTFEVSKVDNFAYTDPIDGSVAKNQGIRIFFSDGSRLVFRLSGTGSAGATVRMYVDSYESDPKLQTKDAAEMLAAAVDVALQISKLKQYTGRDKPTVIT